MESSQYKTFFVKFGQSKLVKYFIHRNHFRIQFLKLERLTNIILQNLCKKAIDLISHAPTNSAFLNYREAHVIIRAWAENCSGDKEPTTVATSLRLYGLRQVVVLSPHPQTDTNRCYQTTPPSLFMYQSSGRLDYTCRQQR